MTDVQPEERGGDDVDWARVTPGGPWPGAGTGPQDPATLIPGDEWGVTYGDALGDMPGAGDPEAQ